MKVFPHLRWTHLRSLAAVAGLVTFSLPVFASLGGNLASVEADRVQMRASSTVISSDSYDVHQIQAPDGTVVNEYVSSTGVVFAVAWHGQFLPDMQQILGAYFTQYSAALQSQAKRYGRHPLNIQQPGLVVQTGGHMRDYYGRVYVPSLLPKNLNPDQIQ